MYGSELKNAVGFCCDTALPSDDFSDNNLDLMIVDPRRFWSFSPQTVEDKLPKDLLQEEDETLFNSRHANDCLDILRDVYQQSKITLIP